MESGSVGRNPIAAAPDAQMRELVDDFLAAQRSPGTRASYASDLAVFLGWLAASRKHPLQTARPDIDRYRNWLAETIGPDGRPATNGRPTYAPVTVARKLSAVRAFYTYLTERRVLTDSPAVGCEGAADHARTARPRDRRRACAGAARRGGRAQPLSSRNRLPPAHRRARRPIPAGRLDLDAGHGTLDGFIAGNTADRVSFEMIDVDRSLVRDALAQSAAIVEAFPIRGAITTD